MCTSVPQIEVFRIRMRTSFGPGSGTGTSVIASPGPGLILERARMVLALMWVRRSLGRFARETITNRARGPARRRALLPRRPLCSSRARQMNNRFYGAFDSETLGGDRKTDYRNAFQI